MHTDDNLKRPVPWQEHAPFTQDFEKPPFPPKKNPVKYLTEQTFKVPWKHKHTDYQDLFYPRKHICGGKGSWDR